MSHRRGMRRGVRRRHIVLALALVMSAFGASVGRAWATSTFDDTFTRADTTALGSDWQEVRGDLLIRAGELRNAAVLGDPSIAVIPASSGDTQAARARFASTGNNSIPALGLVLRYESSQHYYVLYRLGGGTSVLRIAEVTNGVETVLAQTGVPNPSEGAWFVLNAAANGSTLSVTLDGNKTLSVTDPTPIGAGSVGVMLATRTTNATLRISHRSDDFHATFEMSAPPAPRLAVALAPEPPARDVPPGTLGVTFATVLLDTSGSSEDVFVRSVQLDLETDVGASYPAGCRLDAGGPLTTGAHVVDPTADGTYTFTLDSDLLLPRGTTRSVQIMCDIPPNATDGDTIEWRLRSSDLVGAWGATTAAAVTPQVIASTDNQNRVTIRSSSETPGTIPLDQLQPVLRSSEIALGSDLGEQKPPLTPHTAINFQGQSPPNTAWLSVYPAHSSGDGTYAADMLDSEINGEQCGGVAALVPGGSSGRAVVARSCDAKSTDTLRLGLLDMTTGTVTPLVNVNLFSRIDTYGGTNPPANCDHHQAQLDYHMYCQWVRTVLTIQTAVNGTVTFTATSWLRGTGLKNDPSRNDPNSPDLTLIGTATWSGARPAGVALAGTVGFVGTATQGWERVSLTNLTIS